MISSTRCQTSSCSSKFWILAVRFLVGLIILWIMFLVMIALICQDYWFLLIFCSYITRDGESRARVRFQGTLASVQSYCHGAYFCYWAGNWGTSFLMKVHMLDLRGICYLMQSAKAYEYCYLYISFVSLLVMIATTIWLKQTVFSLSYWSNKSSSNMVCF